MRRELIECTANSPVQAKIDDLKALRIAIGSTQPNVVAACPWSVKAVDHGDRRGELMEIL